MTAAAFHLQQISNMRNKKILSECMLNELFERKEYVLKKVSFRIQPECGKIRTRKTSVFGHFSRNGRLEVTSQCISAIIISTCKKKSWNFLVRLYYEMNTYFEYWFRHCPQWKRFWIFWQGTRFEYNYQNMYCFCTNCF